jgi:AraC-like DNA-binding protein
MSQTGPTFCEPQRFKSLQDLARRLIGRLPDNLFAGFTGLRYHVAWAPLVPTTDKRPPWPGACAVCCELAAARDSGDQKKCLACNQHHFDCTIDGGKGHHFVCHLGVYNYCLPIRICGETVGIAYLQAVGEGDGQPQAPACGMTGSTPPFARLDRHGFAMASHFLRILIRSAETAGLAEIRERELSDSRQAVAALEHEQSHLYEMIERPQPTFAHHSGHPQENTHTDDLPARLLTYLATNFAQSVTLQHCAEEFGMNASYLSDVFSRAFGVSFKACLTELRMEKAKELLTDPALSVTEVAFAVGYASENRFRSAFKQATGLPPRAWRHTMFAAARTSG